MLAYIVLREGAANNGLETTEMKTKFTITKKKLSFQGLSKRWRSAMEAPPPKKNFVSTTSMSLMNHFSNRLSYKATRLN